MEESHVTRLPPPERLRRVPTGAVEFGEDWPGLFIRGDDAIGVMLSIRDVEERLSRIDDVIVHSALSRLRRIADIIERDVVVRGSDV